MAGERIRHDVWRELLDAERLTRYYEALAEKHRRRHLTIRVFLLLAAIGGMASFLEIFPDFFREVAGLIAGLAVAVLVALDFAFNEARKTAVLSLIKIECRALGNEWKGLWANLEHADDDDARRENERLARRLAEVTGWAGHAEVGDDDALNEESERIAYKTMREDYAAG